MAYDRLESGAVVQFAGLMLGIVIGVMCGPIVFLALGWSIPVVTTAGAFLGAVLGYLAATGLLAVDRWRRDRELQRAVEAVRVEAGLPPSLKIKVKDAHVTLEGEVESYAERHSAERVIASVPGIKGITNRIRLRPARDKLSSSPEQIRRRIEENLVRMAERDGRGIRVLLNDSRVVLEGTVRSWAEASEAEDAAWTIPGVVEVVNRLNIAA
jgi:osmotically-inducible protein OsmY